MRDVLLAALLLAACSDGASSGTTAGASDGGAGAAGSAGAASGGASGQAGSAGQSGSAAQAGSSGAAGSAGQAGAAGASAWQEPACSAVKGTWAVTFTHDDGATIAALDGALSGVAYTYGLAALDTPNVLLAEHTGRFLRSTDSGCTWTDVGEAPGTITKLAAAKGGRVYGFGDNSSLLFRVDDVTPTVLKSPTDSLHGLGVDPSDGAHIRIAGGDGIIYESTDGGSNITAIGQAPPYGCFYVVAFDPKNLEHAICGTIEEGTFVTMDGGKTWTASEGDATWTNTFSVSISPADGNVVWIEGIQLGWHNGQQVGPEGRRIWRSEDGGLNFSVVLNEEETDAVLFNGNLLAADPVDTDVLYFTFGSPPVGGLPSESFVYRLLASTKQVQTNKQSGIDSYDALVFSPANPKLIYLGISSERPAGP